MISKVPQPVQKEPLKSIVSSGGINEMSLAVALGLCVRLYKAIALFRSSSKSKLEVIIAKLESLTHQSPILKFQAPL